MNAPGNALRATMDGEIRIQRAPSGRGFRLEGAQWLPCPRERVFEFFSDVFQLETITPPWLRFSVLTPPPVHLQLGTKLDYRLRVHGVPLRWQSYISQWDPPHRFADEQLRGPYWSWHHQHEFETVENGTLCRDLVDYRVFGGALINSLFVRRDLLGIFQFRQRKLRELFGQA